MVRTDGVEGGPIKVKKTFSSISLNHCRVGKFLYRYRDEYAAYLRKLEGVPEAITDGTRPRFIILKYTIVNLER